MRTSAIKIDKPSDAIRNAVSDSEFRCYIRNQDESAELMIMEQIGEDWTGEGVSAESVVAFLAENESKPVNVRINSPGGLVYDGLVIYNALASHPENVTVTIEGLAYSAASFIAMAGDVIRMHEASDIGIHRAHGVGVGNAINMRAVAQWLDTIDEHLVEIYSSRTGASREQVENWLDGDDDGTLFSAKSAVENGFADEMIPLKKAQKKRAEKSEDQQKKRAMGDTVKAIRARARQISV